MLWKRALLPFSIILGCACGSVSLSILALFGPNGSAKSTPINLRMRLNETIRTDLASAPRLAANKG